jgi:hypothetical protein
MLTLAIGRCAWKCEQNGHHRWRRSHCADFGAIPLDMYGKTAYMVPDHPVGSWWLVRRLIYSPFGATLTGIRETACACMRSARRSTGGR